MKRLIALVFVLPLMLAMSQAGNASDSRTVTPTCSAGYCAGCDSLGGICVQHATFCDCHV
jgi:hypothetical protein